MTTFYNKKMTALAVSLSLVASSVISANALEKQEEGSIEDADLSNVVGERAVTARSSSSSVVYKVTEDDLNVRKGPGTSYSIVGKMNAGDIVDVHEIKNGWARITYKGNSSVYCSASYIKKVTRTGKILKSVYMRETYSFEAKKIASLEVGTKVEVVAIGEYWSKIKYSGKTGYIPKEYLQETTPASTVGENYSSTSTNTSATKGTVTAAVNLRSTASWSGTKLLVINKGEEVEIVEKGSEWTKVKYSSKTGYIPTEHVKVSSGSTSGSTTTTTTTKGTVTAAVNLRSTASWSGTKLLVINKGEEVEIVEKGSEWTKVKYSSKTGYIPTEHVKVSSGSTSGSSSTEATTNATITEATYIRATASWSAEKVLLLNKGDKVTALSKTGDWVKVSSGGKTGYVSVDFINISEKIEDNSTPTETTTKYVVNADSLNVRSGPGTNYSILGSVKSGTVINVYSITNGWAKIKYNNAVGYVSASYIKKQSTTSSSSSSNTNNSSKLIYLDAGHGGKDPGAIGTTYGTYEKDGTLDVSNRVVKKLKDKGYTVKSTRSTDEYISLLERTNKANSAGATIFVSIHFNSASTSAAAGIETLYKVDGRTSNVLADKIQSSMVSVVSLKNRGLKTRSDLSVLNNSKMPAVLIEGGFLSNPGDENLIRSSSYRETLANAIVKGIEDYFKVSK